MPFYGSRDSAATHLSAIGCGELEPLNVGIQVAQIAWVGIALAAGGILAVAMRNPASARLRAEASQPDS